MSPAEKPPQPVHITKSSAPIEVTTTEPLEVTVTGPLPTEAVPHPSPEPSLPPNTTAQEDLTTLGQRRINLVWEHTQAAVTVLITLAAIYCAIRGIDADVLNFAFVAVISTYYARTNHSAIGGIGAKPAAYVGR